MQAVFRASYARSDAFHHDARGFRNRLVIIMLVMIVAAVALLIIQWRLSHARILPPPQSNSHLSGWALMLLVMVFGIIGALVTTIPAMAAIPTAATPYNFPLQQSFVKVLAGSLFAVVGVLAIGNPGVVGGFSSLESLLAIAIVFGAGQQAVTQFLDKRAEKIIGAAP